MQFDQTSYQATHRKPEKKIAFNFISFLFPFTYFLFSNWKLQNWFCSYPRARPKSLPPPGANFPFLLLLETLQSPGLHNNQHDKKFKKREEKLKRGGNSWFKPSGSFEAEPSFLRFSIARLNVFSEQYKSQGTGNCQSIIELLIGKKDAFCEEFWWIAENQRMKCTLNSVWVIIWLRVS